MQTYCKRFLEKRRKQQDNCEKHLYDIFSNMRMIGERDSDTINRSLVELSLLVHQGKLFYSCDESESNISITSLLKEVLIQADFSSGKHNCFELDRIFFKKAIIIFPGQMFIMIIIF